MTECRAYPTMRAVAALAGALSLLALATSASAQGPPPRVVPGRFVVVYHDWVANPAREAAQMARAHGANFDHVYGASLKGCAGFIPPGRLVAIRNDPRVAYVEPEQVFEVQGKIDAQGRPGGGGGTTGQIIPPGVRRLYGDTTRIPGFVDVNVAVLDTGIQRHADLNVVDGADFTGNARGWEDGHGHGTHVAGTIAAINNQIGVVGVAPGANLYAVKVLDDGGSGHTSWILNGIDWVLDFNAAIDMAEGAESEKIRVANMSLGGGHDQAILDAIANAADKGVTIVVAAGNDSSDCRGTSPANSVHEGVITVSALSDSDGVANRKDVFASFSNNGRNEPVYSEPAGNGVDVIAPGVSIYSTYKGGGYATMSGTSMASPHVAGVAALAIASRPLEVLTPAIVKTDLLESPGSGGYAFYQYQDGQIYYYGLSSWRAFSGDLDSYQQIQGYEPLVNARAFVP